MSEFGLKHVFYIDGELYRITKIARYANLVDAYNYTTDKPVQLLYSDFKRRAKKAVSTADAARIMGIAPAHLREHLSSGFIEGPQRYGDPTKEHCEMRPAWSEEDLMRAHDALISVHVGKRRNDGKITPKKTIRSKYEIRAAMADNQVIYVKGKGGKFVPVFD